MSFDAVMIDMEFLDTTPTAAILSIGMVAMDTVNLKIGETFGFNFDPRDCVRHGMTIGADTVAWWVGQDQKAIKEAFATDTPDYKHSLEIGLVKVSNFFSSVAPADNITVWQQGSLDAEILRYGYDKLGKNTPWKFWNVRDLRTLASVFPDISGPRTGTAHNALDDAKNQAEHLFSLLEKVRGTKRKAKAAVPLTPPVDDDDL